MAKQLVFSGISFFEHSHENLPRNRPKAKKVSGTLFVRRTDGTNKIMFQLDI